MNISGFLFTLTIGWCMLSDVIKGDPIEVTCQNLKITVHAFDDCEKENLIVTKGTLDPKSNDCELKVYGGLQLHKDLPGTWKVHCTAHNLERNVTDVCAYLSYDGEDDGGTITQLAFDICGFQKEESCDRKEGVLARDEPLTIDVNPFVEQLKHYEGNHTIDVNLYDEEDNNIGCMQMIVGVEKVS